MNFRGGSFRELASVVFQIRLFSLVREFTTRTVTILTWGGQHGGVSVALAFSFPPSHSRDALITITDIVVVFSILVQGLAINRVLDNSVDPSHSFNSTGGREACVG